MLPPSFCAQQPLEKFLLLNVRWYHVSITKKKFDISFQRVKRFYKFFIKVLLFMFLWPPRKLGIEHANHPDFQNGNNNNKHWQIQKNCGKEWKLFYSWSWKITQGRIANIYQRSIYEDEITLNWKNIIGLQCQKYVQQKSRYLQRLGIDKDETKVAMNMNKASHHYKEIIHLHITPFSDYSSKSPLLGANIPVHGLYLSSYYGDSSIHP